MTSSEFGTYYRRRLPHYQAPNETFHAVFRLFGTLPTETIARLREERLLIQKRIALSRDPEEQRKLNHEWYSRYFGQIDNVLDRAEIGPSWLGDSRLAQVVSTAIRARDGTDYDLLAFTVMPNHVHMLVTVVPNLDRKRGEEIMSQEGSHERTEVRSTSKSCAHPDVVRSLDRKRGEEIISQEGSHERTEVRSTGSGYILTDILRTLKGSTAYECNRILQRRGAFWQHESYDHVVRNDVELEQTIVYVVDNPVEAGLCTNWRDWRWSYAKGGYID